jgi:hypothetical protein
MKISMLFILPLIVFSLFINTSSSLFAAPSDDACAGVAIVGGNCDDPTNPSKPNNIVQDVVNVLSVIVGIAAVIMIMVGGFKYITSNGDAGSISSAKNTILYAIVGLVVVIFAQTIVRLVINKL